MKRTPPIAFYAMIYGPIDPDPATGIDETEAATSNDLLMRDVARVEAILRSAHPGLAGGRFCEEQDEFGTVELWFRVEDDERLVISKTDLLAVAEAVRTARPESSVFVWIRDRDDNEFGVEVFRDEIRPDQYRRA